DTSATAAAPRLSVQLSLSQDASPDTAWTEAVAAFIIGSIPNDEAPELTMVDSAGRLLYAGGRARAPAALPPLSQPQAAARAGAGGQWWPLGVALVAAAALVVVLLTRTRPGRTGTPARSTGPLAFVAELSDRELVAVLGGEREAVVAAVLAQLAAPDARRVSRALGLGEVRTPAEQPPAEVLAALAAAIRDRLPDAVQPADTGQR
ncbi:MAG TPA: hypothetical protein VM283_03565, partial [Armatimonadota bacterium]|nr:hypothetical protein [Armatimonadota bacterium]